MKYPATLIEGNGKTYITATTFDKKRTLRFELPPDILKKVRLQERKNDIVLNSFLRVSPDNKKLLADFQNRPSFELFLTLGRHDILTDQMAWYMVLVNVIGIFSWRIAVVGDGALLQG